MGKLQTIKFTFSNEEYTALYEIVEWYCERYAPAQKVIDKKVPLLAEKKYFRSGHMCNAFLLCDKIKLGG